MKKKDQKKMKIFFEDLKMMIFKIDLQYGEKIHAAPSVGRSSEKIFKSYFYNLQG